MKFPVAPTDGKSLSLIMVPLDMCIPIPCYIYEELSDGMVKRIIEHGSEAYMDGSCILGRPIERGRYEIIYGYERALILSKGDGLIPLLIYDYTDADSLCTAIRWRIESSNIEIHRLVIAEAFSKAKQAYQLSDEALSEALGKGYSRSFITNTLRLLRLPDGIKDGYQRGVISNTQAKVLSSAKLSKEERIDAYNWMLIKPSSTEHNNDEIKKVQPNPTNSRSDDQPQYKEKTSDDRKFDNSLSESIGAPVEVKVPINEDMDKEITIDFFGTSELEGIAKKLGIDGDKGIVSGRVIIKVRDYEQLGKLTDHLVGEF